MLGTELHPDQRTSVSARHCRDSTARGGHSSSTHPATAGMVAWDKETVALAEELEQICRNGILSSFCCFSPIVSLFCHSSGFSSSFSNPAASWHHSSTLLLPGNAALCSKMLHEASTAPRGLPESRHNLHARHTRVSQARSGLCLVGKSVVDAPCMEVGSWSGFGCGCGTSHHRALGLHITHAEVLILRC